MVALFLIWGLIFLASRGAGNLLLKRSGLELPEGERWFAAFWVGFLGLSSVGLAVAAVMPLRWELAGLLVPLAWLGRGGPRAPWAFWWVLAAMTSVSVNPERVYDTALYHRPLIEWMSQEGLIAGLGNLHYRFGFSSGWFVWSALADHGPLFGRMGSAAAGVALASFVVCWLQVAARLGRGEGDRAARFLAVAVPVVCWFVFSHSFVVSPSPNLGAALAVVVVIWLLLVPGGDALALAAAGAAVAVKMSAAVLLPVCLWRTRRWWALAGALALPLVLANYRTTGCPLFPSAVLCVEKADGVGAERARGVARETREWARHGGPYPEEARFWSAAWIPGWASSWRARMEMGLIAAGIVWVSWRRAWDAAAWAALGGVAYVLVAAPDFRFGCGYLAALVARGAAEWRFRLPAIPPRLLTVAAVVVLVAGGRLAAVYPNYTYPEAEMQWSADRWWRPARAWKPAKVGVREWNGIRVRVPLGEDDRCGAAGRPCAPAGVVAPGLHYCAARLGVRGGYCR